MAPLRRFLLQLLLLVSHAVTVRGDGTGLIGWGKTLYNPTCSFACRNVIRKQQLQCTPASGGENHGTAHNPVSTPPSCFVNDPVFLKTMALCIDIYCSLSDKPKIGLIEDYWASHLGTGTLGDYSHVPAMPYHEALALARNDEARAAGNKTSSSNSQSSGDEGNPILIARQHSHDEPEDTEMKHFNVSSPLPAAAGGSSILNATSFVTPKDWQLQYNYMSDFETNERGHSTTTIVISIVAIGLPVALSLVRCISGLSTSRGWIYLQSIMRYPAAWGRHHRVPFMFGIVPTRGQLLYIFLISFLNVILLLAPYVITQPQASFSSTGMQTLSIIGNRAGSMAMGNVVALILFSARNNVLFLATDWSYSTYLLLHRWLGYWTILHTIIHSFMLMANYVIKGTYNDELVREYWVWGIVGTVAASAILVSSLLPFRQKFYEIFLASHVVLSLLFLIGYYYHIWYCYSYNWGYEIWMFIAGGIWGADRTIRLGRMILGGSHTAVVTAIGGANAEYIRIDVNGLSLDGGVVYLCFPSLTWRFWESHPFSVAYNSSERNGSPVSVASNHAASTSKEAELTSPAVLDASEAIAVPINDRDGLTTTFFCRTRAGMTKVLTNRALKTAGFQTRLRVLVEGPYNHSGRIASQLKSCKSILCIAGGVGITGCLPYTKYDNKDIRLFWSNRKPDLADEMAPILAQLTANVQLETTVGQRLDLESILRKELLSDIDGGLLAIIVCGPPGMADEVREKITWLARFNTLSRPYLLLDEAFSW